MKTAREVRSTFLRYFEEQGHRIVPSAPVISIGDPTLMFTNAGMNQFKDVFLATGSRDYSRAADTQKCIRVSGKHNDLEEVGVDTYHHTFFEMLGNWSFGDYFKKEAIGWAWDLLVNHFQLDPERLYVTVFAGDEADGLEPDTEAEALWPELTGIPASRVLRFGKKANFWEMGDTGPCGPCTEIHYDLGPEAGERPPGGAAAAVNGDTPRVVEIWNLVFIEFNRNQDGSLSPLPQKHVDTGMGLERLVAALQRRGSNYDTDLFTPIIRRIEEVTGVVYERGNSPAAIACRVIADHVRALSVAFADGALPSNEGRGYVLRRILRRASRFGRQNLNQGEPFIHKLVPAVVEVLGEAFPEIKERRDHIALLLESEEKSFAKTLDRGLDLYAGLAGRVRERAETTIPGAEAYDLYATFGFPRDLVELMAREDGLSVDAAGWDRAEATHREASKQDGAFKSRLDMKQLEGLPATKTAFYRATAGRADDGAELETRPLKLVDGTHLILAATPFYAESGGQVGDTGVVEAKGFRFLVEDTQKSGDVVLHVGRLEQGRADALPATVVARADAERRRQIMANHTGTHLLHWALHQVLGDHATQQGSLVAPDRLRFDVAHPQAITPEQVEEIERLVNDKIWRNAPLTTSTEDLEQAKARGVTALFGEKYDERVRVVDIGGYSTELCGGTHCGATGDIGAFVITSESAVQAGVRRIEAVTGPDAIRHLQRERRCLREAAAALKTKPDEVAARVEALQSQLKELRKSGGQAKAADAGSLAKKLLGEAPELGGAKMVVARLDVGAKDLAAVADVLRNGHGAVCGLLAGGDDGKIGLVAFASQDLAGKRVHAGNLAREVAGILGGGGGGRPDFAQAGGRDASQMDAALAAARTTLSAMLGT